VTRLILLLAVILGGCAMQPPYDCTTDTDCEMQCIARGDTDCAY